MGSRLRQLRGPPASAPLHCGSCVGSPCLSAGALRLALLGRFSLLCCYSPFLCPLYQTGWAPPSPPCSRWLIRFCREAGGFDAPRLLGSRLQCPVDHTSEKHFKVFAYKRLRTFLIRRRCQVVNCQVAEGMRMPGFCLVRSEEACLPPPPAPQESCCFLCHGIPFCLQ